MDKPSEVRKKLFEVLGYQPNLPIPGVVTKVNGDVCEVLIGNDYTATDVKLKATIDAVGNNELLLSPKVGSNVLLLSLSGDFNNLTLVKMDELELFQFKQGDVSVAVGTDGLLEVKKGSVSLFSLLTQLATTIKAITVATPVGPSGTPLPPTLQKVKAFEDDLKTLLK